MLLLSHPPPFEHHSLPFCPTYLCMPAKKCFVSISIPIAYDSRSAVVSSRGREMLIWKIAQTCMEVANLNFWCSSSFCVSSSGVTAQPHRRPGHTSQPIIRAFSCTCPLLPCMRLCSSTPGQGAIKADAPLQLNSELRWHLMRKVQVF